MSLAALPLPAHPVPLDNDVAERYLHELVELLEEVRRRARNLGLDEAALGELQAPFALRCDAFLWRAHRLLAGDSGERGP